MNSATMVCSRPLSYSQKQSIKPLNHYFQLCNHYIEVQKRQNFCSRPQTLLELFLWMANHAEIKGIRANNPLDSSSSLSNWQVVLRLANSRQRLLLRIFNAEDPYQALHHMNRYGVLGHYLDCFAAVTGQMQYDLFHGLYC